MAFLKYFIKDNLTVISGSFLRKQKFKSSCLKQCHLKFKRDRKESIQLRICTVKCWSNVAINSTRRWFFEKLSLLMIHLLTCAYKIVAFMYLISLQKWRALFLISCSSYTSLECLTNWLPEVDCERVLSITCHEKYSELFTTLKCPIGKCIAEVYQLR